MRVSGAMHLHEEGLHPAIKAALAHLIAVGFDEGVVPPFHLDANARCADRSRVPARALLTRCGLQANRGEEAVGDFEDRVGAERRTMKVFHGGWAYVPSGPTGLRTPCIQSTRWSRAVESRRNWMAIAQSPAVR